MDLGKLASFLETDVENLRTQLLVYKQRSRQIRWSENGLLDGETVNTSDLDFAIEGVSKILLVFYVPVSS
jgi:translation initiation factor 3 subunit L